MKNERFVPCYSPALSLCLASVDFLTVLLCATIVAVLTLAYREGSTPLPAWGGMPPALRNVRTTCQPTNLDPTGIPHCLWAFFACGVALLGWRGSRSARRHPTVGRCCGCGGVYFAGTSRCATACTPRACFEGRTVITPPLSREPRRGCRVRGCFRCAHERQCSGDTTPRG